MKIKRRTGRDCSLTHCSFVTTLLSLLCLVLLVLNNYRHTTTNNDTVKDGSSVVAGILKESLKTFKSSSERTKKRYQSNRRHRDRQQSAATNDDLIFNRERMSLVAGLNCDSHGGPSEEIAKEMVYWEDILSDSRFISPFKKKQGAPQQQYLTFETGRAGWNHVRMAMETAVVMAVAMGRTLVLPPKQTFPMMSQSEGNNGKRQIVSFSLADIFPLDYVSWEHLGLEIITMQEFLDKEAITGHIRDESGRISFPPYNVTDWDESWILSQLFRWLRNVTQISKWDTSNCIAAFPASTNQSDILALKDVMKSKLDRSGGSPSLETYIGKPPSVDASAVDRLKEMWADRKELCIYNEELQNTRFLHFPSSSNNDSNIPAPSSQSQHGYAFLFFEDSQHDLWMKRFIRDHIRYVDKIQCAAARVVDALRQRSRTRGDPDGNFDSFHIPRCSGDVGAYNKNATYNIDAYQMYEAAKEKLKENSTVYIATDETDRGVFDHLKKHYDVVLLDDFQFLLYGVNTNFYGMIDQLVASRSRVFLGCFWSTFSDYVNRLRGYHANQAKAPRHKDGIIESSYQVLCSG